MKSEEILQVIKERYNKLIWYLFTVSLSTIVALASYLILHHPQ